MTLVIWKKGDSSVYYKMVKGSYYNYRVGLVNQYGHEVLFVLPNVYHYERKLSFIEKIRRLKNL